EDNFWEIGSGPCGPCSEIHWDRGEKFSCGKPTCALGCDCDRYMEIWNLVFSQFDGDGKGNYERLAHPNIDTGMGLERLACVIQEVGNLFEVDTVQNIMKHISKIAGVEYGKDYSTDVSLRVITDHIRSTVFMIGDGVIPSNEGRGYVLRRLLRRAARHGRLLGIEDGFLYKVCETVIKENETAYPELLEKKAYIEKVIKVEEERFAKTIGTGMQLLNELMDKLDKAGGSEKLLSGEDAFKLYDTFGFPIDLTKEIISERGISVDEEQFKQLM
ncbi:MAG: alanine--tRNA ligase-related protein, partial [Hydrogenoanaerobacterium sp.]